MRPRGYRLDQIGPRELFRGFFRHPAVIIYPVHDGPGVRAPAESVRGPAYSGEGRERYPWGARLTGSEEPAAKTG